MTGLMLILHHILTTQTEPRDFIKSPTLYVSVHMELGIRLSFYLRSSLEGYTVGTTAGFPFKTMETSTAQSRH
jgi:hypothetical protein